MKILLVNNQTRHMDKLAPALSDHEVEIQVYEPGIKFNYRDKDLIILSGGGGEGKELYDKIAPTDSLWYGDEMKLVRSCPKPIIGICMGFEVIAAAFGAKPEKMPIKGLEEYMEVRPTLRGWNKFKKLKLKQFEAHDFCIKKIPAREFKVLAKSSTGIEMIKHRKKPILATQFHPEFPGGTIHLNQLLKTI